MKAPEDPVEYRLDGVNQVQANVKAGLTFASGLRSILRQDPDIVLLGEIRDEEIASIAVRAAITGHVVFSTIHTNDTASTVNRLVDMGIKPYLVSTATVGIIAQRLIKRICPKCKTAYTVEGNQYQHLGIHHGDKLYKGEGCNYCGGTGYYGHIAIHEIMAVTKEIKAMINQGVTTAELRNQAHSQGMRDLSEEVIETAKNGITTMEQAMKIAFRLGEKPKMDLDGLIKQAIEHGASDIHFTVGADLGYRTNWFREINDPSHDERLYERAT